MIHGSSKKKKKDPAVRSRVEYLEQLGKDSGGGNDRRVKDLKKKGY